MIHPTTRRRFVAALILSLFLIGCGGGGGAPPPSPSAPVALATLQAALAGDLETSVVDPTARASFLVDLLSDGTLSFGCAVESGWLGDIMGMHIHRGAAGVDGPIEVDLLDNGATFDSGTRAAEDTFAIDPLLAAEIAATPGDFYVNIHTSAGPAGFVRQQLAPLAPLELHTTLLGDGEVPVADPSARGGCTLRIEADKTISYRLGMRTPALADILAAHIHAAASGVNGPIVVDLDPLSGVLNPTTGLLGGSASAELVTLARLCNDPRSFYLNVHTAAAASGVARGQLTTEPSEFWAPLRGSEEVMVPSDLLARGGVSMHFHSFSAGRAHLAVPLAQGINNIIGAHIHEAPVGVEGPVVIDLQAGGDYIHSVVSFSAEGSITCDRDLLTRMLSDPSAFYVNFHTSVDPAGAVRGQVSQSPVQFFAVLLGTDEVVVSDPGANGTASVIVSGVFQSSFQIKMGSPAAATLTTGHVHDAESGANGPILIDLLGGTDVSVSGSTIIGDAAFTGRTFARLLAFAERFYVNVHTAAAPGGIARGQLAIRDQSAPPANLVYTSPVTYSEGVPISNSVPSSSGGAVASYSVAPALPAGLSLQTLTGVLSGTPAAPSPQTNYTVTAANASGMTTASIQITVLPALPTGLTYQSPVTYTVGTAIANNTPSNSGGAITSYAVAPSLPAGLALSTTTGVISGNPTSPTTVASYTVTGSNSAGSTTFAVSITVNSSLLPPSGLSYSTPVTYATGTAIAANSPTIGGGAVASWSVAPTLPTGLTLSATGVISGTPAQVTAVASYTVTATNAAGTTTASVSITVILGAPSSLNYSNSPNIAYVGTTIANMAPSAAGGTIASYAISPALSAGLAFSTSSGVVSGTPTATAAQTTYTVTATNAAGSTTASVIIVVY